MQLKQPASMRRQAGLTLIELMIAMVAGLIVIGAALAFTVSTVRAYGENIRSTRLSQELRTGMNLVVRELRRAGYDSASVSQTTSGLGPSAFTQLSVGAPYHPVSCLFYKYDQGTGTGSNTRGFRHSSLDTANTGPGSVQMNATDADSDCGGADWVDLTDPKVVNITVFKPTLYETKFCNVVASRDTNGDGTLDQFDTVTGSVRTVTLCLKGSLVADPTVVRYVTDTGRIRADDLVLALNLPGTAQCDAVNAATVSTVTDPVTLNTVCGGL
jgi:type IV pilus assembly protein PilW